MLMRTSYASFPFMNMRILIEDSEAESMQNSKKADEKYQFQNKINIEDERNIQEFGHLFKE